MAFAPEEPGIWERFADSKTTAEHILANLANVRLHSRPPSQLFGVVRPNAFESEREPDFTVFRIEWCKDHNFAIVSITELSRDLQ